MTADTQALEGITAESGLTIDELAAKTKVASRTIRFYQSKGLLPRPKLCGRVAYYGELHIDLLTKIGELQDRGLSIRVIKGLMERVRSGEMTLNQWLGLEEEVHAPWVEDQPVLWPEKKLMSLLSDFGPGALASLEKSGAVQRQGKQFLVESPELLKIGVKIHQGGVDFDTLQKALQIMRKHMGRMTAELAQFYIRRAGSGFGTDKSPESLGQAVQTIRSHGLAAIRLVFGHAMEDEMRKIIDSGKLSEVK